jgi:polysaccharide biosynthesis protein PslG
LAAVLTIVLTVQACGSTSPASATSRVNNRFFGMHVPTLGSGYPASLGRTVGAIDLTTNGVYWPDLETSSGVWSWDRLDGLVNSAHANGAQPMIVLGMTPSFHSTRPGAAHVGATVPVMAAWKTYVRTVATRYGTRADYEIWPEPGITSNWKGSPKQLAALVAAAAKIIHGVSRKAVVVSPAMVLRMRYQRAFMDRFFASKVGGKRVGTFVDAVGLDPYPVKKGTPEDSMALLAKARKILRSHRVSAPVWNVEINYGVVGGGQTIRHHSSGTRQASYVVRTYVLNAAAGVRRVYWLGWGTFKTLDVALAASNGTPTKAGRALKVVASWLNGQKAGACAHNKKQHLYACKQVKSGRASWVYWTTKGKTVVRAPKGSRHVATMTGAVSKTRAHKKLTITSAPIRVYH